MQILNLDLSFHVISYYICAHKRLTLYDNETKD